MLETYSRQGITKSASTSGELERVLSIADAADEVLADFIGQAMAILDSIKRTGEAILDPPPGPQGWAPMRAGEWHTALVPNGATPPMNGHDTGHNHGGHDLRGGNHGGS